jgi:hypothetical protein
MPGDNISQRVTDAGVTITNRGVCAVYDAKNLMETQTEYAPGKWGPAKPLPRRDLRGWWNQIMDTWAVFTGKAAAVRWF